MGAVCSRTAPECLCSAVDKASSCPIHGVVSVDTRNYYRGVEKTAYEQQSVRTGLRVLRPEAAYVPGSISFKVEICNAQRTAIPEGAELRLNDNGYFYESSVTLPAIPPGKVVEAELPAEPRRGLASIKYLREECKIRLLMGREELMKQTFYIDLMDFAGDLMPTDPTAAIQVAAPPSVTPPRSASASTSNAVPPSASGAAATPNARSMSLRGMSPLVSSASLSAVAAVAAVTSSKKVDMPRGQVYNLYLLGGEGAGKTSFLQSVMALIADFDSPPALGNISPTNSLQRVDFSTAPRAQRLEPCLFNVFDTWGMSETTYVNGELGPILRGEVPLSLRRGVDPSKLDEEDLDVAHLTRKTREAHAVVFFVAADKVENERHMSILRCHLNVVRSIGFKPLVIISRVDTVVPQVVADPFSADLGEKVTHLRKRVSQRLGVAWKDTCIWVSYGALKTPPTTRDFNLDRLTLLNLKAALQLASKRVVSMAPVPATPARSVRTPVSMAKQ